MVLSENKSLQSADLQALTTLALACLANDGGLSWGATERYLRNHYLPPSPGDAIGAFVDTRLVACCGIGFTDTNESVRVTLTGLVHPEFRRQGIGNLLFDWAFEKAKSLLSSAPQNRPHVISLVTESLTEVGTRFLERRGFTQVFAEDVMGHDLEFPIPEPMFPPDIQVVTWEPELAGQFFEAYAGSFRTRPGFPNWSQEQWVTWAIDHEDFRAEMSLLAVHDHHPIGFIVCSEEAITQVGVRPAWRRRGLGTALTCEALRRFKTAGEKQVILEVNVNNPEAAQLYMQLGFKQIGRRARYEYGQS